MQLKKIKRKNLTDKERRVLKILGLSFFLIGGLLFIGRNAYSYYNEKEAEKRAEEFLQLDKEEVETIKINIDEDTSLVEEETPKEDTSNYIGVLEIPKINLKRGFFSIDSKDNNVNKNIQVIKESDMPDVVNGNLIIASHSGNSYVSFFKDLYKLSNNDTAYIYYNGIKYTYILAGKYDVEKTGEVAIHRDNTKSTLTLITCSKNDNTKQEVYILELESEEDYE